MNLHTFVGQQWAQEWQISAGLGEGEGGVGGGLGGEGEIIADLPGGKVVCEHTSCDVTLRARMGMFLPTYLGFNPIQNAFLV